MVEHGDFFLQFNRDFHRGGNQDHGLVAVLEVESDFLELADDREIIASQERVEVFEDEQGGFDLLDDLVEGGDGVAGCRTAILERLNGGAGGYDAGAAAPFECLFLALARDVHHQMLDAHLFTGDDVEDRVASANKRLEFNLQCHWKNLLSAATRNGRAGAVEPPIP